MKTLKKSGFFLVLLCLSSFISFSFVEKALSSGIVKKQAGNTISGYVFGNQRQPMPNVNVELTDDLMRTVGRVQTNSSGRYIFGNLTSGKYRVRVLPYETNYQEQIQEVEIINYSRQSSTGAISRGGLDNSQLDFYLRIKKGVNPTTINGTIFAQEIPKEARAKFDAGVANINLKKNREGLNDIKSAVEIFPDYYDALLLLGNEYIKLNYHQAAQALLTKAVEVNPKSYSGWYGLAYADYSLNQIPESSMAVTKAIDLNPESVDAILLNGILLKQQKKYDESLIQLKKAKELAKGSVPQINWQMALLYGNNLKDYAKAAEELELLLKVQPDSKDSEMIKKLIATFREKAKR